MEVNLQNERKCLDNLRMSPDNLLHLHNILLGFGLKGTREIGSLEYLGIYLWTCAPTWQLEGAAIESNGLWI